MKQKWIVLSLASFTMTLTACGSRCEKAKEEIIQPVENVVTYLATNPDGDALAKEGCGGILGNFEGLNDGAETIRDIARSEYSDSYSRCIQYVTSYRLDCSRWYYDNAWYYEIFDNNSIDNGNTANGVAQNSEANDVNVSQIDETLAAIDCPHCGGARPAPNPAWGGRPVWGPGYSRGPIFIRPAPGRPVIRPIPSYPGYPYPYPNRPIPVCRQVAYTYCAAWEHRTVTNDPKYTQAMNLARDLDITVAKTNEMCNLAYDKKYDEAKTKSQELYQFLLNQVKPNGLSVYQGACQ